ncbi:excinuclease [Conchiformibius kuhniae]|uniref:Excinuclease n=1 Tax=Conchiformibius kuhniae TaxID=211502 RepID=A0A8T9MUX1_9NEIS|nr:excinuclease [Conchiformibius kuhniae]UOP04655.1 excinuclease [Conchiformibius kuhniae]
MKRFTRPLLLAACAALGLGACQSKGSQSAPSGTTASASAERHSGACRQVRGDTASGGRNVLYRCDGRTVLASADARAILAGGANIQFGGGSSVIKGGLTTRQAARRLGKSDEAACERAYISAAKKFQETAAKLGGSRVSNFQSYLDKRTLGGGQYECEVGTFHARVLIKGDVAR